MMPPPCACTAAPVVSFHTAPLATVTGAADAVPGSPSIARTSTAQSRTCRMSASSGGRAPDDGDAAGGLARRHETEGGAGVRGKRAVVTGVGDRAAGQDAVPEVADGAAGGQRELDGPGSGRGGAGVGHRDLALEAAVPRVD